MLGDASGIQQEVLAVPLAFQIVRFEITGNCREVASEEESIKLPYPVIKDWDGNPVIDVALQNFDIQYLENGAPLEYTVNRLRAKVELVRSGHQTATVKASVQIRPRAPEAAPHFGYKAEITALVIADMVARNEES
ncbi:hypothetical protein AB0I84_29205 [Streptomyces spectabilis]|uniref:hypothetical protein n=1 Tax=Streptomyces spectabilis TaxID=68270 RepID=UPI0033DEF958